MVTELNEEGILYEQMIQNMLGRCEGVVII